MLEYIIMMFKLSWNVLLCFWATVSAPVCLVCSSTVVRNYDDDDNDDVTDVGYDVYTCSFHKAL